MLVQRLEYNPAELERDFESSMLRESSNVIVGFVTGKGYV